MFVCVCMYVCICMYVCVYVSLFVCMYVYACMFAYVCVCMCMYVRACVWMFVSSRAVCAPAAPFAAIRGAPCIIVVASHTHIYNTILSNQSFFLSQELEGLRDGLIQCLAMLQNEIQSRPVESGASVSQLFGGLLGSGRF